MSNENEYITVRLELYKWEAIRNECHLVNEYDYEIKSVEVKDDFFQNDEEYKRLKKASLNAYKQLKDYEFKTRHNIC